MILPQTGFFPLSDGGKGRAGTVLDHLAPFGVKLKWGVAGTCNICRLQTCLNSLCLFLYKRALLCSILYSTSIYHTKLYGCITLYYLLKKHFSEAL